MKLKGLSSMQYRTKSLV
ncbi:hypothetical protein C1I62_04130 [Streptococcus intermedius]|nr:hypothetical protein A6J72_09240 [Streptococcus intermedius]PMR66555.1 hypothetical protein C1I62_04130 [Streptococcus intermedius]